MVISEAWKYNDGKGRLKSEYVSKVTGAIYPVHFSIPFIVELENEARKKKAAAAAKAWSAAQSSASSKTELNQIKAAQAYERSLQEAEAAKKYALAAASKASAQQAHIAAIKAQTSEIKANTARNIAAQKNPVEYAFNFLNDNGRPVQEAAQVSQENAKMQEEINYLPEVQVKSDFSKYLLWGGVAVLAFYLLKKKKG